MNLQDARVNVGHSHSAFSNALDLGRPNHLPSTARRVRGACSVSYSATQIASCVDATSAHGRTVAPRENNLSSRRWPVGAGGDSPFTAHTRPPPTNPERPPSSRHINASAESWCATLHQGVPCGQRQDVVVAHQPGGGEYFLNKFTPALERECRFDCGLSPAVSYVGSTAARQDCCGRLPRPAPL